MKRSDTIRKIIAGVCLLLFVFSVTPKKLLHDLLANHKDLPVKRADTVHPLLQQAGFYCHCDNLVVESPFTNSLDPITVAAISGYFSNPVCSIRELHSVQTIFSSLSRPPPGTVII